MPRRQRKTKPHIHDNPSCYEGFSYVPAAVNLDQYNLAMYIRYRSGRKSNHMRVKQKTASITWVECPDRDICVVAHAFHNDAFHPGNFDKCFHFDMFNQASAYELGMNYVMPNFVHDNGDRSSGESRKNGNIYPVGDPRRVTVLADSGGFQYVSGKADWINPYDLADWYSDNVDAGMQLDIPLTLTMPDSEMKKFTDLQNRNTSIIRSRLRDHVELINVIHGKTLEQRLKYKDNIEDEHGDLKRIAFGGMVTFGPLGLANAAATLVNSGKRYSQYHLLGITSSHMFPIMIALGELGWKPHITADSSTHKMSANSRKQYMQYELGKLRTYDIGKKALEISTIKNPDGSVYSMSPLVNRYFTCNCPICSAIKYTDVLGFLNGPFTLTLLSIHNMIHTQRYVSMMKEIINNEPYEVFMKFAQQSHASHSETLSKELMAALDYIRRFYQDGKKSADAEYDIKDDKNNQLHSDVNIEKGLFSNTPAAKSAAEKERKRLYKILDDSNANLDRLEAGEVVKSKTSSKSTGVKSRF